MKQSFLVLLLLSCLTLLVYARTANYPFVFDDGHLIKDNPAIHNLSNLPRFFVSSHVDLDEPSYRPFLYATYALNYAISGLAPWSYRAFDILLHILCSFLVYSIAMALIRERGGGPAWPAAAAAVLFCVHPVQTETVIYISARSALLVGTLFLASFYCYLNAKIRGGWGYTALSLIAFALALLTKETAAVLLPFFFIIEYYFKKEKGIAFSWSFIAAAAAMTAVYSAVRLYLVFAPGISAPGRGLKADYITHWAGWISYFPIYIRLLFFPYGQSIEYPGAGRIQAVPLLIGTAVIVFLLFLLAREFWRKNYLIAGLFFLAALSFLPEFMFPFVWDLVMDYRLYLPLAALCIAIAATLARVSSHRTLMLAKSGIVAAAVLFSIVSFSRTGVWASEKSIWEDVAIKYPQLSRPHNGLGLYYAGIKDYGKALQEFEIASSLSPDYAEPYHNLAITYIHLGLLPQAEEAFLKAISLNNYYSEYLGLEKLYIAEGNSEKAVQNYVTMAEKFPDHDVLNDVTKMAWNSGRAELAQAFMREPVK